MTVTPSGLPPWSYTAAIEYYGGHLDKRDYMGQGAVNARTDVSARQIARLSADLSAVVRVAPLCVMSFTCNDSSPAAPTVNWIRMMSGVLLDGYEGDAAPGGYPSGERIGNGSVRFTFPTNLSDDFGVQQVVDIQGALPTSQTSGAIAVDHVVTDPNADTYSERIQFDAQDSGGAVADASVVVEIW